MVFGSGQGLHPLAERRSLLIDIFRNGLGAHEGNGFDLLMFEQAVHHLMRPVHHIQHPRRKSRFREQLRQPVHQQRRALGGLHDKGVAAGNRQREHPAGHHHRKVERCNAAHYPKRVPVHARLDSGSNVRQLAAHHQRGNAGGKFHTFNAALHFAERFLQAFAVLQSDQSGQLVPMLHQQLLVLEEIAGAARNGNLFPGAVRL
ncbi:hypothetical protein D3C73_782240 [compost metagenome]